MSHYVSEDFIRTPEGDAVLARHLLVAMSSRDWESHCWTVAEPVLERVWSAGPYVFRKQVEPGSEQAFVMTEARLESELVSGTGLSGWKCSFNERTHKIDIKYPEKTRR